MMGKRDAIAGWRETDVADVPGCLVKDFADRKFETLESTDAADDRQVAAVWRPLRLTYVFDHHARRAAQERGSRQRAFAHPSFVGVVQRDRQLTSLRHR